MLFITASDKKTMKLLAAIQQVTLRDERVALACKFFKKVRVTGDVIGRGHPLAKVIGGKKLPRIVLLTRDGTYHKKLEGKITASKLYKAMDKVVRKDSKGKLKKFVSEMRKILTALDSLDADRFKWNKKFGKIMQEGKDTGKMKVAKRESDKIDARDAQLKKQVAELMTMTVPKPDKRVAKH
jgi:hypothetical protein